MGLYSGIAGWVRDFVSGQSWLAAIEPSVRQTPDWAFLAVPTAFLIALLVLVRVMGPPGLPKAAKAETGSGQDSGASSAAPAAVSTSQSPPARERDDDNRTVRIFISSTFVDMGLEREVLVKQTFPGLRTKFRARGVEFVAIDLRWGVTEAEVRAGDTLPICLREVDRCEPWFVGLLGERYGSLLTADQLTPERVADFPILAEGVGRSLTEIEIMQGVLRKPGAAQRALFFERDAAWLDTLSKEERQRHETGEEAHRDRLRRLKANIRASGARIVPYASPADIGRAVEAALSEQIEAEFPETERPDPFELTQRLHRAYARERRGLHVGADTYRQHLDRWAADADAPPVLITGASGAGKSTLLANWAHAWAAHHPGDIVFEHYLGASPDSADPVLLMRRLWTLLDHATGEAIDLPNGGANLMELSGALSARIARALSVLGSAARIVLALDGLDKLSSEQNLRWLVDARAVKLVASSLEGEAHSAALERGWTPLAIAPLDAGERRELIERTLTQWGRSLSPAHTDALAGHDAAGNPLFLKTVLDELRVSATDAVLKERLDHYLEAADVAHLFTRMVKRLERDCAPDLVAKVLPLIWASRAGLEEGDLIAIAGAQPLHWARLRDALGESLRDVQGRLAFSHDFLRNAVAALYLSTPEMTRAAHLAIADHFEMSPGDARWAEEYPYQLHQAEAWDRLEATLLDLRTQRFAPLRQRGNVEMSQLWRPLMRLGRHPEPLLGGRFDETVAARGWTEETFDLAFTIEAFLRFVGMPGAHLQKLGADLVDACRGFYGQAHTRTLTAMNNLAQVLHARGAGEEARRLMEEVIATSTEALGREHPNTLASMSSLAVMLQERGEFARAREMQTEVAAIEARTLGAEHPSTLMSQHNLGAILRSVGEIAAAAKIAEQVLEIRSRVLGPYHPDTIESMRTAAVLLHDRGELERADALAQRAFGAAHRILGPEHATTLGHIQDRAARLSDRGEFVEALKLREYVLRVRTKRLGGEHPAVCKDLSELAATRNAMGDHDSAQQVLEHVLDVRARTLGADHPETIQSTNDLACVLTERGQLERAQQLHERASEDAARLLGQGHPNTLRITANFAMLLQTRGELRRAVSLQERILEATAKQFGPKHPKTIQVASNLATALNLEGDAARATALMEEVLEARLKMFGPRHPDSIDAMANLGAMLARTDVDRALSLQEEALKARIDLHGADHPKALVSAANLAKVMRSSGHLARALELNERAYAGLLGALGPEHSYTLTSMNDLALSLRESGEIERAQHLQEEMVAIEKRVLGAQHLSTILGLGNLATTLEMRGDLAAARALREEVVAASVATRGADHAETLGRKSSLGRTLLELGDLEGARAMLQSVEAAYVRTMGHEHFLSVQAAANVGAVLYAQEDYAAAISTFERVVHIWRRTLGDAHAEMKSAVANLAEARRALDALGAG